MVSGDQKLNDLHGVTALSLFYMIRTKLPMALNVIRKKKLNKSLWRVEI